MSSQQSTLPSTSEAPWIWQQLALREWLGLGFVLVLASVITIEVPLGLSRSGSLAVTLGDFVGGLVWGALVATWLARRWTLTGAYRSVAVCLAVFCVWMVVVSLIRLRAGDEVLQAFLVLRTTLIPIAAYFIFAAGWETPRRAMNGLVMIEVALNVWHLPEWDFTRYSPFLGNSIIYTGLLVMLVPINAYVLAGGLSRAPVLVRVAAFLNLVAALVFPMWAGSRVMTAVLGVTVLGTLLILAIGRLGIRWLVAAGGVALVLTATVWLVNPNASAYGIYRLVPPPVDFGITAFADPAVDDTEQRDNLVKEMATSDAGRGELIQLSVDSIQRDPLIGEGQVYFPFDTSEGTMEYAAHNFVLEHTNAYGLIGFALYALLFVLMLAPGVTRLLPRQEGSVRNQLALMVTAAVFAFSLVQPTMMIMPVVMTLIVAIGALKADLIPAPKPPS